MNRYWKLKALFLFVVLLAPGKLAFSQTGSASNIQLVQSVECEQSGISGSYACTLAPTGTGHLLTAQEFDFANTPGTPATPPGWTQDCVKNNGSAGQITYFSYPNAPAGITSVAFVPSSSASSAVVSEWSGMATASPFDGCDGYVDNNGAGTHWSSGAALASQTDLAIGAALNRTNDANGFAPSDVWTALMDAPQTHSGAEGWTAYIANGLQSPFTALGTMTSAVDVLSSVALYKSAVADTTPTGALVSSYSDFENSTDGTTLTAAILNAGTHGMGINQWTLASSSGFTVCTAGSLPSYASMTTNGTTYPAGAGTRGICYDMATGGANNAYERIPADNLTVTAYVNVNVGTNVTSYSSPVFVGAAGADGAAFTINSSGQLELECSIANPVDYPISPATLTAANTTYGVWLQYVGGGTHTLKVYSNPSTNPSLIGTATCPAQGSNYATEVGFGEFHAGAAGLVGTRQFDSFAWDTSGAGINITPPGNTVQVTVGTNPAGLAYSVDGTPYSGTQILTWTLGTNHTLTTTSSQNPAVGTQNNFVNWSDGTSSVLDTVTATIGTANYSANFNTSYQLTTSVSPVGSGTVSPSTGGYYAQGSVVPLVATPNAGYSFSGWTGSVANFNSAATTIAMNAPQSVVANNNSTIIINAPASGGGIGLVQQNAAPGAGVGSLSATFTSANTAGNLILAFVRLSTTTQTVTLKDIAGNTYIQAVAQVQNSDGSQIRLFYAKNILGAAANTVTATFSATNNHPWLAIYEYSGLSTTSPLDQTISAQGNSAAPSSGATPVTTSVNELVFGAAGLPSSFAGTQTAGSGYALLEVNPSGSRGANESELAASTGAYTATFTLSGSANWSALVATFAAPAGPTVTSASLPNGTQNAAYSSTLAATGGTLPYTWSISSGTLPAGLTLAPSTGTISGTPTGSTGTSNFTVQVSDASSLTATKALALTVVQPPTVSTASLPNASENAAYSTMLAASGGTLPYTWSITSGTLPTGLTLTASTGAISGTPTGNGASSFTAQVSDANSLTAAKPLTLTVVVSPPIVITTSLPNGTQNAAYSATLAAAAGTLPYTWSITSGTLPNGLTLAPGTGTISGTPTATGTSSFTVQVSDANLLTAPQALTLTVAGPPSVTTTSLLNGTENAVYSATLAASGGTLPYTWSIASGSLPAGLTLASSTGTISGTPTGLGASNFTVQVSDANSAVATSALSITVAAPPASNTVSSYSDFEGGSDGNTVTQAIINAGTHGAGVNNWSTLDSTFTVCTAGNLPSYLNTTVIGGATYPAGAGTRGICYNMKNGGQALEKISSKTVTLYVNVNIGANATFYSNPVIIGNFGVDDAAFTINSSGQLELECPFASPEDYPITGSNQAVANTTYGIWLQYDSAGGRHTIKIYSNPTTNPQLIGTATCPAQGSTAATLLGFGEFHGGAVGQTGIREFDSLLWDVSGNGIIVIPVFDITTAALPNGTQGTAYNQTLAATGGTTPYTWSLTSGPLPAGLTLSSSGVISGTPSGSGTSNFTVQVTSANLLTATRAFSLTVVALPAVTTTSLPGGTQNAAYSTTLAATGGTLPYTWSITSGSLPAGLTLAPSTGAISGTPSGNGTSNFTVQVSDVNSLKATQPLTLAVVVAPPTVTTTSLPNGTQNAAYTATLAASAGTLPYTWSITSGSLPGGLTLTPGTGAISGTPSGNGTSSFTVQVSDGNSLTAAAPLTLTVVLPPTVSTTSLPGGTQNAAYSATLAASGGTLPYTWSITSGSLPSGLTLTASTGAISGSPSGTGTSNFTVQVSDANSQTAAAPLALTVVAPPTVTTALLPNGTQNVAYNAMLAASGGTLPYTWSVTSGTLPTGLTLTASTGAISGTPTGSAGTSNFTVQVADANSLKATKALTLTVVPPPTVSTTSLPNGTQNGVYSATLAATGGTLPYTWSIISGTLPAGLTLTASTGTISGTPTGTGTSNFTVQVSDANSQTASAPLSLTVAATPTVTTASLPNGTQNAAYNAMLAAAGGTLPYTWSITSGTLPTGLTLTPSTGAISGTPTGSTGTSNFTVQVSDANSLTATKPLSVTVVVPPTVTTTSLPVGTQNVAYSATLAASGGTLPYTWSITSGSLPSGLTLTASTGAISGTPTGTGTSNFTVQVSDANLQTASKALTLTIVAPLTVSTVSLSNGAQNVAYSATLAATGGTLPYTWSITSGTLPTGLTLTASTGAISGTPTGTGTSNFTVQVSDANSVKATKALTLTVVAPPAVSTSSLPGGTQNVVYSASLAATGGTLPYTWSITAGTLPTGLTLTASTGAISGTPTGTGTSNFTVQVADANSAKATKALTLTVVAAPSVSTASLPNGTQNVAYSATLAATGGTLPYTWSITSGTLPTGLTLTASTGAIAGTPTGTGASNFTVQVSDANSVKATKALTLTVVATLAVTTTSLSNGTQNAAYSAALAATGGTLPYTWSITSGTLPTGLTLTVSTGAISGTPTGTGTSNFTVQVSDANSLKATKALTLTVVAPPTVSTASLPGGTQNVAYSATLAATGGTLAYTWSITSGTLPTGLTLTVSTGAISGTPTGTGTSNFTVQVADANSAKATKALALTVVAAPSVSTASLPNGTQNVAYSATLAATGGTLPYTWSITSGTLPTGLTLTASSGAIAGTPTGTGASNFTVQVSDANSLKATKALTLTVVAPLAVSTASLPGGTQNAAYNSSLTATGGTLPYTWSITSGTLPTGLTLTASTGAISGTPSGTGTSNFTVQVSDANSLKATKALTLTVVAPPTVSTASLPGGTQNLVYSAALAATGGTLPYTWSITSGTLPTGLTLTASTGAISGTPTGTGTSSFTVQVSDANSVTSSKSLSITIGATSGGGIGLVQANAVQGSSVASVSVAFPGANTVGNLILAFVRMSSATQTVTLKDSAGNTYIQAVAQVQTADGSQARLFYAKNISGAAANTITATFSASNNHPWMAIYEYSGLSTTSPLDQTASAQGNSAAPSSGATAVTTGTNELVFGAAGLPSSSTGTQTAGTGYVFLERDTAGSPAANESELVTATGAYTASFTLSGTANWSALVATFKQ